MILFADKIFIKIVEQKWKKLLWLLKLVPNRNGHTLVEMVLAAGLGVFLMGGVYTLKNVTERNYLVGTSVIQVYGGSKTALAMMERDIRGAKKIKISHSFDGIDKYTTSQELILETPSINPSGNIIPGQSDHIMYYLKTDNPKGLYRTVQPGSGSFRRIENRLIARHIDSLTFSSEILPGQKVELSDLVSNLENLKGVGINIKAQKILGIDRKMEANLTSTVRLRNR